jgi:hypothetical protein
MHTVWMFVYNILESPVPRFVLHLCCYILDDVTV